MRLDELMVLQGFTATFSPIALVRIGLIDSPIEPIAHRQGFNAGKVHMQAGRFPSKLSLLHLALADSCQVCGMNEGHYLRCY